MLAGVEQNAAKEWMLLADEVWIKSLRFPPYYPGTVQFDKYNHVTLLFDTTLTLRDYRAPVFVFEKEELFVRNMM